MLGKMTEPDKYGVIFRWTDFYLTLEDGEPGSLRFFSKRPDFPVSVAYPGSLTPVFESDPHGISWIGLDNRYQVIRRDFMKEHNGDLHRSWSDAEGDLFRWIDNDVRRLQLHPTRNIGDYWIKKKEEDLLPVGASGFRAPYVIWNTREGALGGASVFFHGRDGHSMWQLSWRETGGGDVETFQSILKSFRWLDERHFRFVAEELKMRISY